MNDTWLFVGHLVKGQTSLMRMNALRRHGIEVTGFNTRTIWNRQKWLQRHVTTRLEKGSAVREINKGVLSLARKVRPKRIWFDKQEYIYPETILELRKLGAFLIYYTPDPYFTLNWKRTELMDSCLPLFDLLITSKKYELEQYKAVGPDFIYLPLGYCDEVHRPISVEPSKRVSVGFIGGWEPHREAIIEAIASKDVSVRIWGYAWDHLIDGKWTIRRFIRLRRLAGKKPCKIQRSDLLANNIIPHEIYEEEYAHALSSSNISLGFLRKICPDQHTTRSFEIPACGSMMLADRSDEHQELFTEGKEAEYFSTKDELLDKVIFYTKNEDARAKIARQGYARCQSSGYSYYDRMDAVLKHLKK